MACRTRFAPSPTGYLHIGGARTALYCWLEARRRGGEFVLRIEDTDRERSTQAAIDAILQAMDWLGLDYDEGPIYQTHRLDRYAEVAEQLVAAGKAYYAYETKAELEAMREAAMAAGEKPRYNGAYRERNEPKRDDPNRVIRLKNPQDGTVVWEDKVKGRIVNVGRLGGTHGDFNFDLHAARRIQYIGVTFRTRSIEEIREIFEEVRKDIWPAVEARKLQLPIDQVYKFADIGKAFEHMEANKHLGKIVVTL